MRKTEWTALKHDTWVRPFLKQYRKSLILAISLGILTFICGSALMFTSGFLISRSAALPENILLIYIPIVLTRAFGIGRPVFRYVERLVSHNWVLKMTSGLRVKLYETLEQDAIFFKTRYKTGDILGLLAEDINHLQNLYLRTILPTVIAWVLYGLIILLLGYFSVFFALFMLLLLGIIVWVVPAWSVVVNGARQTKQKQLKNELYRDLTDNVLGISDWIFSQRGAEYVTAHERSEEKLRQVTRQVQAFNRKRDLIVQLIFGIIALSLLVFTSQIFVGHHGGAANWIAAFVLTVFPLIDAFAPLPGAAQETNIYQDSLTNLNQLPQITPATTTKVMPTAPYQLAVKAVHFAYPQGSEVLKGIDLTVAPGEKIALLGKSGSGKSTLAHLIRGDLRPTQGAIQLNEVDTADLDDDISQVIGVIQQNPYLFHTTILNNLRLGNEEASEASVWEVLRRVGLEALVKSLPQQLETIVDEAGLRFSGGERQRLALARILLQDVPIILLDEPTVGLDPITEQALLDTFFRELQDQTIIWITHHLQGIDLMDRVIFVEAGQITMEGSPQSLAQKNRKYQHLREVDRGAF